MADPSSASRVADLLDQASRILREDQQNQNTSTDTTTTSKVVESAQNILMSANSGGLYSRLIGNKQLRTSQHPVHPHPLVKQPIVVAAHLARKTSVFIF